MDFRTTELCQSFDLLILEILSDSQTTLSTKLSIQKIISAYEQMIEKGSPVEIKSFIIQTINRLNYSK